MTNEDKNFPTYDQTEQNHDFSNYPMDLFLES